MSSFLDRYPDLPGKIELLLLEPSSEARRKLRNRLLRDCDVPELQELLDIIVYATECDVYRGITLIDKAMGTHVLLDVEKLSESESPVEFFEHFTTRITAFLHSNAKNGLEPLYVLAGSVLLLNVFIRVNWTGPPVGVISPSNKHLASQYREKVVDNTIDDGISLESLNQIPSCGTAFSAFVAEKLAAEFNDRCILKSPDIICFDIIGDDTCHSRLIANIIEELQIDGEAVYSGVAGVTYFMAAVTFLSPINGSLSIGVENSDKSTNNHKSQSMQLSTVGIWQARMAFTWQRIVRAAMFNPCETLFKCCVKDFTEILKVSGIIATDFSISLYDENILKDVRLPERSDKELESTTSYVKSSRKLKFLERIMASECILPVECSAEMKAMLIIELALRLPYYNMNKLYKPLQLMASSLLGFDFSFTGKLGIRRKHQVREIAQLVIQTKGKGKESSENGETTKTTNYVKHHNEYNNKEDQPTSHFQHCGHANPTPENIGLQDINDDSDILERPQLSELAENDPLNAPERCILLSDALHALQTAPEGDELNLEFLNAIVVRCLDADNKQKSWMLSSVALWVRCKTEYHRTKTVERATLQLHKLSDSYYETDIAAGDRLEYMWHVWCPSSWGIKRDICRRMCSIGSFLTAYEMYKKLHLWEDAIQCLIIVGRKNDAKEMVHTQLKASPTPLLWCYLGDIEGNIAHYIKAWELSDGSCARAQRTLGSYYFNNGELQKAVDSLELALAINPMRESSQFLLGCAYLRLNQLERAIGVFARVVALTPTSHDAWANLCSAHMNMGNLKEAGLCIDQAVKHNPTKWQFWEICMIIAIRSRDVQKTCLSIEKLIQLGQKSAINPSVIAFLVDASSKFNKSHAAQRIIAKTLDNVTKHITNNSEIWELCARYFSLQKFYEEALECTFRQYRAIETDIDNGLSEVKPDADKQAEHDVAQMKRLTSCLATLVTLLKRLPQSSRKEKRDGVVQTLKSVRERFKARTAQVTEKFQSEMDIMIENAEVEDVICVFGNE